MNAPENRKIGSTSCACLFPIDKFYTPEYYALEKEKIFKKSWLRVGVETQIANVGDYFVKELDACDTSLIIVRGRDKQIRAFHNHCSHRGNRVAYDRSGNTTGFKCRFHSWAYGLDGSLRALPEEHLFPGLDKSQHGLTEVACDTWEGFIFVNVDPKPEKNLREYLGEDVYNGFNGLFKNYTMINRLTMVVPLNWKACINAFVETYHFSTVHLPSAGNVALSRDYPNGRLLAFRERGEHCLGSATTGITPESFAPTPTQQLVGKFGGNALALVDDKGITNPPAVNPEKLPDWLTDIMIVFPTHDIQVLKGLMFTLDCWPISHDKTFWQASAYLLPRKTAAEEVVAEYSRAHIRDLLREDIYNLAMIQTNLNAGSKKYHILGDMEPLVKHTYKAVAERVGSGWE
jgi:phenylpropionate dioxygenase-like ring-hydroxylating dioxygenase large terminal subunit